MYFTSEADAREGERKEPPPELAAQMDEMNKLCVGEPEFFISPNPGSTPHAERTSTPVRSHDPVRRHVHASIHLRVMTEALIRMRAHGSRHSHDQVEPA